MHNKGISIPFNSIRFYTLPAGMPNRLLALISRRQTNANIGVHYVMYTCCQYRWRVSTTPTMAALRLWLSRDDIDMC